jgi:hypothetical protein
MMGCLLLAVSAIPAHEGTGGPSSRVGAVLAYGQDDEVSYGLIFFRDITGRDRFSLSLKAYDLDGEQSKRTFVDNGGY